MGGNPPDSKWARYTTPRGARRRRGVEVMLADETRVQLDALAEEHDATRSATVEALVRAAAERPSVRAVVAEILGRGQGGSSSGQ